MNKKFLSVAMSIFMLFSMFDVAFAAKKDVGDPVLQQIISELNDRMPRFINKYGAAVFVADEQITRGSLLQALYEFDKKSSSSSSASTTSSVSSAGVISKKDYDALNAKVVALERKIKNASNGGGSAESVDIVQIMNDLEPNMPMMLDNSLSSSKVFKALEAKVKAVGATGINSSAVSSSDSSSSQLEMARLKKNINDLNMKVANVELSLSSIGKTDNKSGSSTTNAQVLYEIKNFKNEIDTVNKKVSDMETKLATSKGASSVSNAPSQDEISSLRKSLVQMQQSYVSLGKRLDNIEKEQSTLVASSSSSSNTSSSLSTAQMKLINSKINSIREEVDNIKIDTSKNSGDKSSADIKKIEKRLSNLEKSDSSSAKSESGSSKTSTVAKVSLGLSLVAALFIAR